MIRTVILQRKPNLSGQPGVPAIIAEAGERAAFRFVEFFTADIRNRNTRESYGRAVRDFLRWCEGRNLALTDLNAVIVASYVEYLDRECGYAKPTVKQNIAAIRVTLDYLVSGGILGVNPASSVRGPKYSIKRGKTPVLSAEQTRQLLNSIETTTILGLRDKALIATMVYTFSRISAVLGLKVEDYFSTGKRWKLRLMEKGGKYNETYVHHNAETYLDDYLDAAGIRNDKKTPLFRSLDRRRLLSARSMSRTDALRMVKKRASGASLPCSISNHTFRATGITTYLKNGGRIEIAQQIAGHESARTTGLYDRRDDEVSLDEIERILI
jgi:integrase/recombinase XerD